MRSRRKQGIGGISRKGGRIEAQREAFERHPSEMRYRAQAKRMAREWTRARCAAEIEIEMRLRAQRGVHRLEQDQATDLFRQLDKRMGSFPPLPGRTRFRHWGVKKAA